MSSTSQFLRKALIVLKFFKNRMMQLVFFKYLFDVTTDIGYISQMVLESVCTEIDLSTRCRKTRAKFLVFMYYLKQIP